MFFLVSNGQNRPSILDKNKDEKYHIDFARYCIGQANNELQTSFVEKVQLNKNFYKGNQWINNEDLDLFFKDDTDQGRNRIKIYKNLIRPMVEQFRGNAIRMSINYRVKSISPQAINRRETKLAKQLYLSKIANQSENPFGEQMKKEMAIGDNDAQTTATFNNSYVDDYVKKMNYLGNFVEERNKFEDKQVRIAEELALSGLGVMNTYEYSGHQYFKVTKSENFFFDRSAQEHDLTDGEFMGELIHMNPSEIFEQWQDVTDDQRTAIDNYSRQYRNFAKQYSTASTNTNVDSSGKVPVFKVYWRDGEQYEYGYVKDEFGYDYLTKINHIEEGQTEPKYTDKDLIKNNSIRSQKLLHGKLKRRVHVDTLRMAIIIPSEVVAMGADGSSSKDNIKDILLEYGIAPYQETNNLDVASVQFPYKCYCWGYVDGEIMSPVDDAINPQRFINRILSVAENQINNSRGSGTVIDKSMVDDQDEVVRNMNQSKPIFINAKGRGIQNAIGAYDATVKQGTMVMFNIIDAMKNYMQDVTGVNEALKGESTGSDQLVGVTQLMIQRGSLMQEPFYNAILQIYKQCYQSILSVGKRIYCDNERNLAIAVGDDGLEIIKITKDMLLEDFRCFVKRENSDEMLVSAGNNMLMTLYQLQLIDDKRLANLYGRATPDEVATALRASANEKQELQKMQAKAEAESENALIQRAEMEDRKNEMDSYEATARGEVMDLHNKQHELKKEYIKAFPKLAGTNPQAAKELLNSAKNLESNIS